MFAPRGFRGKPDAGPRDTPLSAEGADVAQRTRTPAVPDILQLQADPVGRIHEDLGRDSLAEPDPRGHPVLAQEVHHPVRLEVLDAEAHVKPERLGSDPSTSTRCCGPGPTRRTGSGAPRYPSVRGPPSGSW